MSSLKSVISIILFSSLIISAYAGSRQMENLDRGIVAVKNSSGVYIGWRLLATDNPDVKFDVFKNGTQKLNSEPITNSTNYFHNNGLLTDKYSVRTILNGVYVDTSDEVKPWPTFYKTIKLNRPVSGVNKSGIYSYSPNDCSVGDLDGDGQYEIVVKWDPSDSQDNSKSGYTGNVYLDAYEFDGTFLWRIDLGKNIRAGAHYTQFMVYDLDGDGYAEVACKTAPGTIDGTGKYVLMGNDNPLSDYRNSSGYVLSGPEYLTVFNGRTGAEINTVAYNPPRGVVSAWGDSYGNRVDRFLACIAYLDGIHPSLVMCRGYYTRTTLAAYDLKDGKLVQRWFHDSPYAGAGAYGQGNHNLSVADVDNDGKDEIIYGACAIDDDGKLMYRTGLGHGDAMHLSDLDPDRNGLEVWEVHEDKTAAYGYELHDAKTGKILWGKFVGSDNGRGLAADIDPKWRGFEMWSSASSNVYSCKGDSISNRKPSTNFRIYWDADLQDELLDGTNIDKWTGNGTTRLLSASNYFSSSSINSTKANPCLSADIIGDWREEVIFFDSSDSSKLVLFTTRDTTNHRIYTLMHDPVYRLSVAWQNVVYNQPPHLGFYIGDGIDSIPWPDIYTPKKIVDGLHAPTRTECKVYASPNGEISLRSPDIIKSIFVYSVTGSLVCKKENIKSNYYTFSVYGWNKMFIIKIITENGISIVKTMM